MHRYHERRTACQLCGVAYCSLPYLRSHLVRRHNLSAADVQRLAPMKGRYVPLPMPAHQLPGGEGGGGGSAVSAEASYQGEPHAEGSPLEWPRQYPASGVPLIRGRSAAEEQDLESPGGQEFGEDCKYEL